MFLNNRIYADEAHRIGILNFLFKSDFEKKLDLIKEQLLSQSKSALSLIKKNIKYAAINNLKDTLKLEAKHLIKSSESKEHKLAIKNFKKS